jgi:hypothetical protein
MKSLFRNRVIVAGRGRILLESNTRMSRMVESRSVAFAKNAHNIVRVNTEALASMSGLVIRYPDSP